MRRFLSLGLCISLLFANALLVPSAVEGYSTNMSASLVLGQPDFTSGVVNNGGISATSMGNPLGACSDGNKLAVTAANRVLIWNTFPTRNQQPADLVLGQPDFTTQTANIGGISAQTLSTPIGCWTDGTKLIVVEQGNDRVLIWNTFPTQNQQAADVVVGQPDFTTSSVGTTASKFLNPNSGIIHNGKLIVSDVDGNRVLIFNTIPTANGASADVVIGQTDFTSGGAGTSASKFNNPRGLGVYNNKLIVGDIVNNRFLIFNNIPTANGASADVVIGQPDFTSNTAFNGGVSCASISGAQGSLINTTNGRLFLPDGRRILIFNSIPTTNFQTADMVIGQPDCTSNVTGTTASTFGNAPVRMGPEVNGKLIVGDQANSRVLIFNNIISTPELTLNGVEKLSDNRLKISGNVKLGEAGHYDLGGGGGISFSINGSDGAGVNSVGNEISDGNGSKFWEFSNTFEPWTGGNGTREEWFKNFNYMRSTLGFSVKVMSRSSNTDTSKAFYFEPFKLSSFTPTSVKFTVTGQNPWYISRNKDNIQRVKDNIDHFEVWVKRTLTVPYSIKVVENWTKYIDKISTEKISDKGEVNLTSVKPLFKLTQSNYQVKAVAVSKESNLPQDSNILNYTLQRKRITTPRPTVREIQTETTPQPTPTARQATPTPPPVGGSNKTCFLWWCW